MLSGYCYRAQDYFEGKMSCQKHVVFFLFTRMSPTWTAQIRESVQVRRELWPMAFPELGDINRNVANVRLGWATPHYRSEVGLHCLRIGDDYDSKIERSEIPNLPPGMFGQDKRMEFYVRHHSE